MADGFMAPPPKAVYVSPVCLGTSNFGDNWAGLLGSCDKPTTEGILNYFYEQGGNLLDTANQYQDGLSEEWVGDWMKKRISLLTYPVIATKYSLSDRGRFTSSEIIANTTGNNAKTLRVCVERSLKRLRTDYIDILYVHYWDYHTSIPEVMQSLNQLIEAGKVIYLGISDAPAWVVSKANQYARDHGLRGFAVYQGLWSAAVRDFKRDIMPMAREEGMALAPWGALGRGNFKTDEQRRNDPGRNASVGVTVQNETAVGKFIAAIAQRKGTIPTSLALAYVMKKYPCTFPVIGGRKIEHLKGNIETLKLDLDKEDIKEIEAAIPFDPGFPHTWLYMGAQPDHPADIWMMGMAGHFDHVPLPESIGPYRE
ncbi:alcohol dehydrogenase [Fusarium verticillioides 7600]|uniref:Alcohol dehydrogenase n=1 Tax=Gibberella moniliformis (strain M3125 / FGSC 7600) TaxID=334819 RepID=W7LFS0_GIBM7|nr:alcohol dehydrogenase [Fusarium verticillioides 7600]EWG38293.1 alcohol dehydrogenase [Fusarium verticillioides 7600]